MPKVLSVAALATILLTGGAVAATAPSTLKGHELAGEAKVSLSRARTIALKARPGRIVDQELEKESGGTGLRYSFDVKSHGKTVEVGVDARTGKVLANGVESAAKEAKEKD